MKSANLQSRWPKVTFGPHALAPGSHCPISKAFLTGIHLFILHSFQLFVFLLSWKRAILALQFLLWVVLFIRLISCHACWHVALRVKWLSCDYKGWRGFLMETCLPNTVGYPTAAVSSWGYRGGFGVSGCGESAEGERGLPESTCRTCPQAHLSTSH